VQNQRTHPIKIAEEKAIIAKLLNLPDGERISLNDSGWDSRVYLINSGEFVFKFPRSETVKSAYRQEIAGFRLASQITSPIIVPQVRWVEPGCNYFGYEGIVGEPLTEHFRQLSQDSKAEIGRNIGTFLRHLHHLRLDSAPTMTLEEEIAEFKEKHELGRPIMNEYFTTAEQAYLKKLIFEEFPEKILALEMEPALCHGDFGYGNMIYGRNGQVGVIDFGDLGYYDRAKDFVGLTGPGVLDWALSQYRDNVLLRTKIAIRRKIQAILNLPFFIGKEDEKGILNTIAKIRETVF
jgi:aminoglycoside phosphotransferase (APT) family kinase protein